MKKKKKRGKKSKALKYTEYLIAYFVFALIRIAPMSIVRFISYRLGDLLFFASKKRRTLAIENVRYAFGSEKTEAEIRDIARKSCRSIVQTLLEIIKLRRLFTDPKTADRMLEQAAPAIEPFKKAKKIHDASKGCILASPHLGIWEVMPYIFSAVGISIGIMFRPLDNEYLERLFIKDRVTKGQYIIPKKNALFTLHKTLQKGISLGILPDQSTAKGFEVDFFGRKATTTPVPAMLALKYNRPIVVVACCRKPGDYQYEGYVSDPIMPGEYTDKKAEMLRITKEMNRELEKIILKYPEQYLWMHNRWKTYKHKKEFLS